LEVLVVLEVSVQRREDLVKLRITQVPVVVEVVVSPP
jgi:hypothetical protein